MTNKELLEELEDIKELILDYVDLDDSRDMLLIDKLAAFTGALKVRLENDK